MAENGRPKIRLTLAINDSDQVRDLITGRVPVAGIDLTCLLFEVEEIFFRFTHYREWEVSELSFAKYCSLRAQGDESMVAIPVFPSRSFRHSAIYVRRDGPVDEPSALAGARIGFPEWTVTATVYARALLQHEYDLRLEDIRWVQGGTNEPGRIETLPVKLPVGIAVTAERQRSLNELLITGDIDAIIAPHPPEGFADESGQIVRLFSDSAGEEERYFARTGIFPIMHVVVLRADVHQRYPWAAANLFKAFNEAKERSLERMLDANAPRTPVPWAAAHTQRVQSILGADPWPYGLDANRATIEAFLEYAVEQGVCERSLEPEDLFAPQVLEFFRV
jgi:4,5-dihydroxyphthalate decarboxylase